jgi:hypothetical protein
MPGSEILRAAASAEMNSATALMLNHEQGVLIQLGCLRVQAANALDYTAVILA